MSKKQKDVIIVGFALFSMFFGAGNLIFPPYLGVESGPDWIVAFLGFIFADVGLALLAVLALAKSGGNVDGVLGRAGKKLAIILGSVIMICLGPLLAIPRTAATTFEMGVSPIVSGFNPIIFSIMFFVLTLILTIRPSKVVDIIGQFLTPGLLIALGALIVKGIITPLGQIASNPQIDMVFAEGIKQGYQTMDALGAVSLATVIIASLGNKGYTDENEKISITMKAGLVAGLGLCLVYGGLTFLGATVSSNYGLDVVQTQLLVEITRGLLGESGKVILAIIVALACLTTAVGLTSAASGYFAKITNGKLKYTYNVTIICVFSAIVSNFGVSSIIKISAPILDMVYPATIVLVVMTIFGDKIKNDNAFKFATYTALLMSIMTVFSNNVYTLDFLKMMPFAKLGFNWIAPVVIAAIIGNFVKPKGRKQEDFKVSYDQGQ